MVLDSMTYRRWRAGGATAILMRERDVINLL